jgi:hypothetical protein
MPQKSTRSNDGRTATRRSNFRPSDHAPHHQIHALHAHRIILPATLALPVSLTHGTLNPIRDPVSFILFYFIFSKLKKKGHFILCFACIFFLFIFVCNIKKKKKNGRD